MCGGGEHVDPDGAQALEGTARLAVARGAVLPHLGAHPKRFLPIQGQVP